MTAPVKVKVQFLGIFKELAGAKDIVLEVDANANDAVAKIEQIYQFGNDDRALAFSNVFVNGRHLSLIPDDETLKDNDVITFLDCISGG